MIPRRPLLLAALAAPALARAQGGQPGAYPTRPINFIIPFAPGGGTDIIARALQPTLQEELGQAMAIENRAGASGTLGIGQVTRARPDGYTLAMTTVSASAVVPPLMNPPPYDILRDQTPVILAGTVPLVVVVPNDSPVRDFAGFLAHAKANPGKLNYSSSGVATQQHLAAELLSAQAGLSMVHVPFRGTGQAVTEVLAGRIDVAMDTLPTYLPHIRAGRVRAIAVTMLQRVEWLPDLPTVAESGFPGFDANVWYMIIGPGGLPDPITERWVAATNRALAEPAARARLRESGFIVGGGSSADAAALLRRDAERYARVIREARIRLD
ncbi:Bug family tripartite tricarboxylate transporter substrate binding protein [Sabulicella glaciei]|uniref:Tripartite tricarboxylate transporter substrate binding protein n=1 Tax=Sabulicella glaciei TaxID=2984948 RepID=A0ABT3NUN3_9PROT|nr:tripartite tricarboxylate transporter substrate binding protein [Roseococcus sp. MDT2-1-1]MCW8085861.1 tripartite tricarboxylate transporter substrate binding protein [Roseococcus sp. MDT2-1-1]